MIQMKKYQIAVRNGIYYAVSSEIPCCPFCGGCLKVRDSKKRALILADGEIRIFNLRRLKCQTCGALHLELPDIFLPHKHYSREVIDRATAGSIVDCPAENSTIYRWSRQKESGLLLP